MPVVSLPLISAPDAQGRLNAARADGRPHEVIAALTALARGWADERAWGTAEAHLEEALRWAWMSGSTDARVELHCEAAEMAVVDAERCRRAGEAGLAGAARRRALAHASESARLAGQVACPAWETVVLLRISDVFDRCAEHAEAAELQVRALRQMALG